MKSGDLHWVDFTERGGRAQSGRRPAIILQGEKTTARLGMVLVCPLTSQFDALRFPGTVFIEPTDENGLPRNSVILVFQLTAIDVRFVEKRVGAVGEDVLVALWQAFDELTDRAAPAET